MLVVDNEGLKYNLNNIFKHDTFMLVPYLRSHSNLILFKIVINFCIIYYSIDLIPINTLLGKYFRIHFKTNIIGFFFILSRIFIEFYTSETLTNC